MTPFPDVFNSEIFHAAIDPLIASASGDFGFLSIEQGTGEVRRWLYDYELRISFSEPSLA